ncbi:MULTISPECIES: phage tail protein [unclassified Pseudodesulfovibrio]|uniref:phage tail protein n=1 Tax=unclassified Pseudodesulfovibrio TaxID=2661612 RepID=UPI000FEBB3FD|nr:MULTISPECIES: phage tail protein [unclassified Pseudodesulfovibrio]MCJ2164651.1 phage tail protein [Pseudodesulfovibrio sp. S3-i]RWU04157.1 phage tail protein [Pseudodesulfovibrio sp. S3]
MRLLQALTQALKKAGASGNHIHSFADQGVIVPTGRDLGHGLEVGRFKYDAVIQVEGYRDDGMLFVAFVTAWLQVHDPKREALGLADPEIDISLNDDRTADIELSIDFEESLEIVPDEDGPIHYNGQRWRVADVPIDVAEELDDMEGRADVEE